MFQAGDGQEALAILKAHPRSRFLVSDIRMPGMDGYALAEAGLELRPDLKVILMTGYAAEPPKLVRIARSARSASPSTPICYAAAPRN